MSWQAERVIWVTVDEPSGTAMVTGPGRHGLWEQVALEAGAKRWNQEWFGWQLDSLNQVADLCTLAEIRGMIYRERKLTPDLLPRLKAARRKKAQRGGAAQPHPIT